MNGRQSRIHKFDSHSDFSPYQFGVSLHSHTMHSKEYLDRLPTYIRKIPVGSFILEWEIGRLHLYTGRIIDFKKVYWTPPLSPREAYDLEKTQIKTKLRLRAMVSLTDHDSVEAGLQLHIIEKTAKAPVSAEWSVPFEQTVFHLGVHNLPPAQATEWMERLASYTAHPDPALLAELLTGLSLEPSVLVVLNHPFWDAESLGQEKHQKSLKSFLGTFRGKIHGLELNGMRSRRENREVAVLAETVDLPLVSGGDRHGTEPNAILNITSAATFEQFVHEIRVERKSDVVLMPQYFEPLQLRLIENAWHALSDAPGEFGRRHWMTRVFVDEGGVSKPLSNYTGTRFHQVVDKCRWVIGLIASSRLRPALRVPFLGNEEGGL